MKFHLRPGSEADADFITALTETVMRGHFEQTWGRWDADHQWADFRQSFPDLEHRIIMCEEAMAGYCAVRRTDEAIVLTKLYLLPNYQNQGIGSSLVKDLIDEARAVNKPLQVYIVPGNESAKRLYERLGLTVTGTSGKLVCLEYQI